ncbi:deoxyguanosinetriphosphate triphosphohydrolase [Erythrobacter litoralis]|uniref:Deoxyguanosinetriphosphate triphosphohydrolase-like protein n=1 Tax=Erythrobacter litoralis (strain HTCC2594) TaxID=314225 RepID=Q2NCM3_ERYLH|nr:deoxyguanosinetriphosphate triphosphohydrolase [Erythrobacter litoralis]ABC62568.1 deoxyguanosinetriphosphate triphosphohydrolase-like protein [Erythrobacter litoralis HTCC2594]
MSRSHLASDPAASRGREFAHQQSETRGPRSAFQRDRDRIIHSIAFRRLKSKTQVFVAPDGDHYRTRLTHSLEVAQIGRVIARALGLDEDLTEALCLAHDIGHPPFGHAGERALHDASSRQGGFDHNAQTLRTLMRLESPYPSHDGLNLSWEVLEGLAKHNGPVAEPHPALGELDTAFPLDLGQWGSLEAQVAAVADDIAYDNHDIDDGLRAGILDFDDLLTLDFLADLWRDIEERYPGVPHERLRRELVRSQIGLMVNDVIMHTRSSTEGMESIDDVRGAARMLGGFSPEMFEQERALKKFMYDRLYYHPQQVAAGEKAREVISRLYAAYDQDPELMGGGWSSDIPQQAAERSRHIVDYIAGMTDHFALEQCRQIYGKAPSGLGTV